MDTNKTPINLLHGFEFTSALTQILTQAYLRRSRQLPANLSDIVATLKGDLLKRMPGVTLATIEEAVIIATLTLTKDMPLSPAFFFQAIRDKYTPPYQPRSFDVEEPSRPDTEQDTINLLDICAAQISEGKKAHFNWRRSYMYLEMRQQVPFDSWTSNVQRAKNRINVERVRDFQRPIHDWTPNNMKDAEVMAMAISVVDWLRACNTQDRKPSDILTPLIDETSYIDFRRNNP